MDSFCKPDGQMVKLLLFSTLLDKSPLTFIYFTTFEKKSQISPSYTTKLFGFWQFFKQRNYCFPKQIVSGRSLLIYIYI